MCEAPAFHHGPRQLVADIHAGASVIPLRIKLPARVCERRHRRHRSARSFRRSHPSSASRTPFIAFRDLLNEKLAELR
jgi:hypothetical protein